MTMVTIVEVRAPNERPGPHSAAVESDLVFVGSDREKALAFIEKRPDYSRSGGAWCWYVYDVALDDPKLIPHDKVVIGRDGQVYDNQQDAWDSMVRPGAFA